MADQLATPQQLASFLQSDLDLATANVVLNAATAVVQAAAGQRLVAVVDDEIEVIGTTEPWLHLPERPATEVSVIELDGEALTPGEDLKVYLGRAAALWRADGWAPCASRPSTVAITYSHGWAAEAQDLELARSATLGLASVPYSNPSGATSVKIDDYAEVYSAIAARMESSRGLRLALRAQYRRRGGFVRAG